MITVRYFRIIVRTMTSNNGGLKRPLTAGTSDVPPNKRPQCTYGEKCYRRNPIHLGEFNHPHLNALLAEQDSSNLKVPAHYQPQVDKDLVLDQLKVLEKIYTRFPDDSPKKKVNVESKPPKKKVNAESEPPKKKINSKSGPENASPVSDITKKTNSDPPSKKASAALASAVSNAFHKPAPQTSSPAAFSQSSHMSLSQSLSQSQLRAVKKKVKESLREDLKQSSPFSKDMPARIAAAAPYNFFLTKVRSEPVTHHEPLSITFRELLDPSLGKLRASLQINFLVDMPWVMHHYEHHGVADKPLLVVHGEDNEDLKEDKLPKNIKALRIKTPHPFGHHHTKMSMFHYEDGGLRVVVSTANLVPSDWHNRTQGLWVSPTCPELPEDADTRAGDSPTEFKTDLLRYLAGYGAPALAEWMGIVRRTDFSDIRVCFVGSVPGSHQGVAADHFGHRRLAVHLKKHAVGVAATWPVVAQCSSVGSLGPHPEAWMLDELRGSMALGKGASVLQGPPHFKVVYPSKQNVFESLDGALGGDCLPYSMHTHLKQKWFNSFLYQWKSSERHRTRAVPHIKTYTRMSPCGRQLAWFHLSSANLSKAAWGMNKKSKASGSSVYIMSYEAGVLFLPQMLINKPFFHLDSGDGETYPPFPMPYDTPPTKYSTSDQPWVMEYLNQYLKSQK